jgi:ABC-type uncharacterized transport system fused permease/ATPase subunit
VFRVGKNAHRLQVIYPHTREEMARRGRSDAQLSRLLERVQLGYLAARDGGWDAAEDWMDVLSGGEKQRIAVSTTLPPTYYTQTLIYSSRISS